MMFKIFLFLISFTYTIAFSELNNSLNQDSTSININGYAAIVNKEIITNSDVQKLYYQFYQVYIGNIKAKN